MCSTHWTPFLLPLVYTRIIVDSLKLDNRRGRKYTADYGQDQIKQQVPLPFRSVYDSLQYYTPNDPITLIDN